MKPALAAFDLDGTLLNTLDDLTRAVNTFLSRHGYALHDHDAVRHFVGHGAAYLLRSALPENLRDRSAEYLPEFLEIYHGQPETASLYPGIPEMLDGLVAADIRLAIVTNKPQQATDRLMAEHLSRWEFCAISGQRPGFPLKPEPAVVHQILSAQGIAPEQAVFIGDSETDIETARNAGISCISVLWGFRTEPELLLAGAEHLADSPQALLTLLCDR